MQSEIFESIDRVDFCLALFGAKFGLIGIICGNIDGFKVLLLGVFDNVDNAVDGPYLAV